MNPKILLAIISKLTNALTIALEKHVLPATEVREALRKLRELIDAYLASK